MLATVSSRKDAQPFAAESSCTALGSVLDPYICIHVCVLL